MKTIVNISNKIRKQLLALRTLFSAVLYAILIFTIVIPSENSGEYLYLEVYNITLLYIIINMLLFARDILSPKTEHLFSKEFVEILLVIVISTILIISLFVLRNMANTYSTSLLFIKVNAILVITISSLMYKKIESKLT